ncbi:hypothetical protein QWM81_00450 [Streptomyces ficellus]|uniref:DUF4333 domain-containing protein n=1 Tax=Streptomyces ficellus TaxID=1977088 RepID=A0ABT7YZ98_9ACTN|nr:hypothetical protein [Streptomyces ficellus]MDN3292537.1 hypothetical protein [Streptomyces ficellus]
MRSKAIIRTGLVAVLLTLTGACGTGDATVTLDGDVESEAARRLGKDAFKEAGYEIDTALTCDKTGSGDDETVTCNGATTKGQHARLLVRLRDDSTVQVGPGDQTLIDGATITGSVDGKDVFTKSCLGGC